MSLIFQSTDRDTGVSRRVSIPTTAYDGEMICDIILSYGWLAQNNCLLNPRRHGILFMGDNGATWVPGLLSPKGQKGTLTSTIPIEVEPKGSTPGLDTLISGSEWSHESWQEVERQDIIQVLSKWELSLPEGVETDLNDEVCEASLQSHEKLDTASIMEIASTLQQDDVDVSYVKGFVTSHSPMEGDEVQKRRERILQEYASSVFSGKTTGNPPVRGPYSEAEIQLKEGAIPLKQRPYQMSGERRTAWVALTDQLIKGWQN